MDEKNTVSNWTIRLNGEDHLVTSGWTVLDLLESLERHPRTVAVEFNGEILGRDLFATTRLSAGDQLELVQFVQGG